MSYSSRFREWRRSARAREAEAYSSYERVSSFPLFLLGLLFIVAFVMGFQPDPNAEEVLFISIVVPVTWTAFAIDYAIGITLSPDRWGFVRNHVLQGLALLFPPLRVLLLGHIFRMLRSSHMRSGQRARLYVFYATALLLVVASVAVVYFERKSPTSNIDSFGDALWWGGETVSTVGYGDFYPVTLGGRLVAAVLFVNGVALLSVITAGLAQRFNVVDGDDARKGGDEDESVEVAGLEIPREDVAALHDRIAELEDTLRDIRERIEDVARQVADTPSGADGSGS